MTDPTWLETFNVAIRYTGTFLGGMVTGLIITVLIIFDGVSFKIGGMKDKQNLDIVIGNGEEGHTEGTAHNHGH